ncbi:YdeI/OmpD-associated family protein [Pelagibacterium nitratireducens]|uniref:YdeI/OmpD-associated family protein n=1 Tax=Pelagibacterium nitratireducens TaxID=1046114 RepID=A0ABZ2I099_9HYPH
MSAGTSRLSRPIQPMPDDIGQRLEEAGLRAAYDERPAYQRNDYLGWIARAKRPQTREKRITQMLDELQTGGVYMAMKWGAQT